MLLNLFASNYRSFSKPVDIPLRPITIFVGPNSSGKSSLLKLFKLMQQSCSERREQDEFVSFGREGDVFENLSSLQGNAKKPTTIKFAISLYNSNHRDFQDKEIFMAGEKVISVETDFSNADQQLYFNQRRRKRGTGEINDLRINASQILDEEDGKIIYDYILVLKQHFQRWIKQHPTLFSFGEKELEDHFAEFKFTYSYGKMRYSGLLFEGDTVDTVEKMQDVGQAIYEFIDVTTPLGVEMVRLGMEYYDIIYNRETWYQQFLAFLSGIDKILQKYHHDPQGKFNDPNIFDFWAEFLRSACALEKIDRWEPFLRTVYNPTMRSKFGEIVTISPLRANPQTVYSVNDLQKNVFHGLKGNKLPAKDELKKLITRIDDDLKYLGSPYQFNLRRIKDIGAKEVYTIEFIDKKLRKVFSLDDVGFGYSQILPIIAAIEGNRFGYSDRTILIEQPELHLHPQFQARLARIMANAVTDPNPGSTYGNQLIIETHSEHVVRGFQVMVAKGTLRPDHIGIYYVSKDDNGKSLVELFDMDEKGFFTKSWPHGFFDQAFLQSLEMVAGKN